MVRFTADPHRNSSAETGCSWRTSGLSTQTREFLKMKLFSVLHPFKMFTSISACSIVTYKLCGSFEFARWPEDTWMFLLLLVWFFAFAPSSDSWRIRPDLQRGRSLCTWSTCSTSWATSGPGHGDGATLDLQKHKQTLMENNNSCWQMIQDDSESSSFCLVQSSFCYWTIDLSQQPDRVWSNSAVLIRINQDSVPSDGFRNIS